MSRLVVAVVLLGTVAAPAALAAIYNDAADGRFNSAPTWGGDGAPSVSGDVANIDSNLVNCASVGEVVSGVIVNIGGSGVLRLDDPGSVGQPIDPGATVNVNAGGTLQSNSTSVRIANTTVLNGGTLNLGATNAGLFVAGTVLDIRSDSRITGHTPNLTNAVLTGSGTITVPSANSGSFNTTISGSSTWTGDWDIRSGMLRFYGGKVLPAGLRTGNGAEVRFLNNSYNMQGTASGFGSMRTYQGSTYNITGTGKVSPGDAGVDNGVGHLTFDTYSSSHNFRLYFAPGSTYEVDIAGDGTDSSQYDYITVRGNGAGRVGNLQIDNGAKLVLNLWTPAAYTTLDAIIIDANGSLTGGFAPADITWNAAAGWTDLATLWDGANLHVTGIYVPEPASLSLLAVSGLVLLRRGRAA